MPECWWPAMNDVLARMRLRVEQDIFAVRQLGREVALQVGLEGQDQTRVATALSEAARVMVASGQTTTVAFQLLRDPVPTLLVEMKGPGDVATLADQLRVARRLVDTMEVDADGETGTVVRMARRLPAGSHGLT